MFLRDLDLERLQETLLLPNKLNSTDYDEEEVITAVASRNYSSSVMNIALPPPQDKPVSAGAKRSR